MTFSLLLASCGKDSLPGKPNLPQSVAPGWTRQSLEQATPPAGLPEGGKPECWKAAYSGSGSATVWACGYSAEGGAFDAVQRARAEADTVKFQEGRYFVLVSWTGASKQDATTLVRSVQKNLKEKT